MHSAHNHLCVAECHHVAVAVVGLEADQPAVELDAGVQPKVLRIRLRAHPWGTANCAPVHETSLRALPLPPRHTTKAYAHPPARNSKPPQPPTRAYCLSSAGVGQGPEGRMLGGSGKSGICIWPHGTAGGRCRRQARRWAVQVGSAPLQACRGGGWALAPYAGVGCCCGVP